MKKTVSIILSMVVIFTLMLSLTGCGDQKKFVGTWEATVDMTDLINQGLAEDEEMGPYLELEEFSLVINYTFKDDGTYKAYATEEELKKAIESTKKDIQKGMTDYFEDYIASEGLDLTVDQLLLVSGTDMDSLMEDYGEEVFNSLVDEFVLEGNFEVKDGKLYCSDGLDADIDENEYETYEISKDELKLLEGFGEDAEELNDMNFYPVTFKKVG